MRDDSISDVRLLEHKSHGSIANKNLTLEQCGIDALDVYKCYSIAIKL